MFRERDDEVVNTDWGVRYLDPHGPAFYPLPRNAGRLLGLTLGICRHRNASVWLARALLANLL